ncbi:MAG TPA: serine/threonine-protein kinase, partial [Albitalea sp.]
MLSLQPAQSSGVPMAPADEHDALPAGTRFGELEILRVLGLGGFGIVYLARDHALEREVALKEYMPASLAGRGKGQMVSVRSGAHTATYALGLRSFVNEARLLARFNHPSLVKVYRFWEDNGTAYMVMPYLQGRTLRDVRRAMTVTPSEGWVRSVLDPLLDALELLHREDVYHRDIAPDNVLLPPGQPPVLLDFGAARHAIGERTHTFTAILKPSYAPIEQYAESAHLRQGPWTDLYALGAVVFYLLRGAPPPPATARAVQDDAPLLPPHENPEVAPAFLAAIEWALAVRPAERPQHVGELRDVLAGRAVVPPATRSIDSGSGRSVIAAPQQAGTFATTMPLADSALQRTHIEPARPATVPQGGLPESAYASPDTTVMPATPTMEPSPVPPRTMRVLAGLGGLAGALALVAVAWALSGRSSEPVATPPAATIMQVVEPVAVQPPAAASMPQAPARGAAVAAAVQQPREKAPRGD